MIGIQLKGRLGNQMFQYAAARSLADRLSQPLVIAGHTLGRPFGFVGHGLGFDERAPYAGMQQNGLLRAAFGWGPRFWSARLCELAMPFFQSTVFRHRFSPRRFAADEDHSYETFDESFFELRPYTWLEGWFQSEQYFAENSEQVRAWFQPTREDAQRLDETIARWPALPAQMAALHIRRGDYARINDALSASDQGWLLPMTYYRDALDCIPRDATLAIFSDDPAWAEREFPDRRAWVSRGNSPAMDMLLMSRCRYNVTANSSFSWWGAWLNARSDRVIFAPKHHLGWRIGRWVPEGIAVAGWNYLEVKVQTVANF